MYVVDDKDTKFYDRISHALVGRGIDCISTSALEERNEFKPFGSFIKVVERSFDCTKDQDFLGFVKKIKLSLKKNGTLIISTINRNLVSKFLTLDIGENLLKLIPLNTHTFYKFIKPEELEQVLSSNNFENIKFKGLTYDALKLKWKLSENTKINYFCSCKLN